jgi:hypothetical protein
VQLTKKKIAILALALVLFVAVAFAAYWIYSNIVHVPYTPAQYTLTLDGKQINDTAIELTATLTVLHFGATEPEPVSDATIHFYLTYENGTIIEEIGTAITDENGVATFVWTAPTPESSATVDYYLRAGLSKLPVFYEHFLA